MSVMIARVGAHNPEFWDETRRCWTGHPHKASEYVDEDQAQAVIADEGLDVTDDAYVLED